MRDNTRFIPGEEIDAFAQWNFGAVDTASLLLAAKSQERQLVEDKERDAVLSQAAHAQGFAEGFAQGQARATLEGDHKIDAYTRTHGQAVTDRFSQLMQEAQEQLEQSQQVMAQGVLELACELARQIVRQELSVNPNVLQPVIREALGLLAADSKNALVRLNPLDAEVLQDAVQTEFASLNLTFVSDATIKPGGCLITSAGTVVDGSLATRWRRAIASLGMKLPWDDMA
jgi:flagellar assembly protein FliH